MFLRELYQPEKRSGLTENYSNPQINSRKINKLIVKKDMFKQVIGSMILYRIEWQRRVDMALS